MVSSTELTLGFEVYSVNHLLSCCQILLVGLVSVVGRVSDCSQSGDGQSLSHLGLLVSQWQSGDGQS